MQNINDGDCDLDSSVAEVDIPCPLRAETAGSQSERPPPVSEGYRPSTLEAWPPDHSSVDAVRRIFAVRMSQLYDGWDDDYDRKFDGNAFLFVLREAEPGDFPGTCRIVMKRLRGRTMVTSSEVADRGRLILPSTEPACCEGSMATFSSFADAARRACDALTEKSAQLESSSHIGSSPPAVISPLHRKVEI